jgi:hypothetical protein
MPASQTPAFSTFSATSPPAGPNNCRETAFHITLLVVICLLLTLPVLMHGAPDISEDGAAHARWAREFAMQFWRGNWYPRWFTDANGGLGGASGFFYPPLASYAATLFWPFVAARDPQGWLAAGYSLVLGEILSAIAAYLWLRSIAKPKAALLGSLIYAIAPYHLATDLYQRCAAAEFWVFVWFPFVMLSTQALIRHSCWAIPVAAVSYALAVLSHPTLALCFAPVAVLYVFLLSDSKQASERIKIAMLMGAALLVGVALDAQYLLPATLDRPKAYIEWQTIGPYDYHSQWLIQSQQQLRQMGHYLRLLLVGRQPGPIPGYVLARGSNLIITASTLAAVLALFAAAHRREKLARVRRTAAFYVVLAVASVFLMNRISSPVWDLVRFLKFLQFPFRLNVMLVIALAALTGIVAPYLWQPRIRLVTLFLFVIVAGWLPFDIYESRQVYSTGRNVPDWAEAQHQFLRRQIDEPPMLPKPANLSALSEISAFDQFVAAHPPKTGKLEPMSGPIQGTASVLSWQPRSVLLQVIAPQDCTLILNHFYYLGWRGRIEGTVTDLPVRASPDGLIEVKVPAGTYGLVVDLPPDAAEHAGMIISLLALVLLAALVVLVLQPGTRWDLAGINDSA